MTDNQKKPPDGQVEISMPEDEESSKNKSKPKRNGSSMFKHIFGHPSRSETSLGEADNDELEKFEIIKIKVEGHRTLLLIDQEDQDMYNEMCEWVNNVNNQDNQFKDNPEKALKDTILKFDPIEHHNKSDALAKVIYGHIDGLVKPDFILRYKNDNKKDEDRDDKEDEDQAKKQITRENFELLLLRTGLILEHELNPDETYTYVKIIAPFNTLCEQAQQIRLKMRMIKSISSSEISIFDNKKRGTICSKIYSLFSYDIDLTKESSFFKKDSLEKFEEAQSRNNAEIALNFFNTSRRGLLVHRMIITANQINRKVYLKDQSAVYVKRKVESLSIDELLGKGVFDKFYPVHDGSSNIDKGSKLSSEELKKHNLRAQLSVSWVKSSRRQPLKDIRTYFGEKLALYFAWLGFYTSWLSVASITGLIVIIYGLIYWSSKKKLGTVDDVGGISAIWDNALTAPYAFLMSIWATCFLETWKRVNLSIQYNWDVINYEKDELPRPKFYGTMLRTSPITLKKEIFFPSREKLIKFIISWIIVFISIGIVIVTVGILIKFPRRSFRDLGYVAPVVTGLVNLATIIILNLVYRNVARFLTDFENHRTETQFEDSLIFKAYLFDFINFYSVLIYIVLFGVAACHDACSQGDVKCNEKCDKEKGMVPITIQLAIIFVGKQLFGQVQEILIPWLLGRWNKTKSLLERDKLEKSYAESGRSVPQWVQDDHLASSKDAIKTEYEEMVIQFGFLALFGVAFPLAPLFAWLNNISEIRSDAFKYIKTLQRPVGSQAQDLGMWEKIMTIVSFIAVLTNATIIAFHSLWMERRFKELTHYNENDPNSDGKLLAARLGFILAFEHLVLVIKLIFAYAIPDAPKKVTIAMERERYLNKLRLERESPALDEYWSGDKDDASLFSIGGSIRLPRTTVSGGNIYKEKSKEQ